jgi:hypothetical protein
MCLMASALALAGGSTLMISCHTSSSSAHERAESREGDEEDEADEEHEQAEHHEKNAKGEMEEQDEEGAKEETITLAQAPDAVRAALAKMSGMGDVKKVERITEDEAMSFEIGYELNGAKSSVTLSARGELMEIEKPAGELPRAVQEAIAEEMKGAKIVRAEAVQLSFFEVLVEKNGKKHEVKIFANGRIEGSEKHEEGDERN